MTILVNEHTDFQCLDLIQVQDIFFKRKISEDDIIYSHANYIM